MRNLADTLDNSIIQEVTTVVRAQDGGWLMDTSRGSIRATRAASCLLEPAVGDRVICALSATGQAWVVAVLERNTATPLKLCAEGDLEICVKGGRFSVASEGGVAFVTPRDVQVVSGSVDINTVKGSVVVQSLTYLGRYLQSEITKVKSIADTFDAVLGRFSQRVKRSYRTVEEYDCVKAKQIDYVAESTVSLHGKTTIMTAEGLVKIDGAQVHVG